MKPGADAMAKGYSQILWVFGEDEHITEVGAMNVFFFIEKEDGTKELVTPPLSRGDILPGVSRELSLLFLVHLDVHKLHSSLPFLQEWDTLLLTTLRISKLLDYS